MRLTDITALGRTPIDPSYPTNRAIAALTTVVAIAGAILRPLKGTAPLESVLWGIGAGLAVFLTWALGRELDPGHDLSAFVGAGLVLIVLLLVAAPSLLFILWLLLVLRLVNRTTELPAKPLDSLGVLGLGVWLTWQGYWMVGWGIRPHHSASALGGDDRRRPLSTGDTVSAAASLIPLGGKNHAGRPGVWI